MRLSLALLLIATTGAAQPTPPILTMKYEQGENIHIANQGGAINRHRTVEISVELRTGGKVAAMDTGISREHNLYNNYSTDEDQKWSNTWSGTWKQTATTLSLDLALVARKCLQTKKTTGGPTENVPCRAVTNPLHFDCKADSVPLPGPIPANGVKPARDVWRCNAAPTSELDLTPRAWVLGKTACVKVLGGRGGTSYDNC